MGGSKVDFADVKEFIQSLVIAGVLAFFIITFVAQSFVVDGESMKPTLSNGERLFVNKFIYRFNSPERGDIVVFTPSGNENKMYIKRIIGLPGEEVLIEDGTTYIDGKPLEEDYINEKPIRNSGPYEIPEEKYFVLGDNRNQSADSRYSQVGFVSDDSISGKAFWVYWPLTEMRVIRTYEYNHSI